MDSQIFAWNGYDDDPMNVVGVDTIADQKQATYNKPAQGSISFDPMETFLSNVDRESIQQVADVIGEQPMQLVFGEGFVKEGIIIPEDYEVVKDAASIPTTGTESIKLAVSGNDVVNALNNGKYYEDIIVQDADINNEVKFYATDTLSVNGITVSGEKGQTNGKVLYSAPNVELSNVKVVPNAGTTLYNMFEGNQDINKPGLEALTVERFDIDNPNLTHNVINVYTPAENAHILVKDSKFNLTVDNSNVLRLANYANVSNVTVEFDNVDWTYENGISSSDWNWAGLVIYQPSNGDHALTGDYTELSTWKFTFKNCRYNGKKVTSNNFGEHNQVMYMYNLNKDGAISDPSLIEGLTIEFL